MNINRKHQFEEMGFDSGTTHTIYKHQFDSIKLILRRN